MSVSAPTDRRFKRARVRPGGPRGQWARAYTLVRAAVALAVVTAATVSGYRVLSRTALLHLQHIHVAGTHRVSDAEVVALLAGIEGQNLLFVDLDAARARLLAYPWIDDASLRRVLPDTLDISIAERQPVGLARFRDALFLVDASGVLVEEFGPRVADLDLPLIDGFVGDPQPGGVVDADRARLASRMLASLRTHPDLYGRLAQVDVSDAHNAVALLDGDPAQLHLGDDHFAERVRAYIELAPALRDRVPGIDYIDLRFDHRIYLRPVAADTTARAARSAADMGTHR
ncbi:MAG: FtsQ-type POTRA domain-containing protein [Vicinamibacterales bacterium]